MKRVMIISFNLTREGENEVPLSIGSLLANLEHDKIIQDNFSIEHFPINLLAFKNQMEIKDFEYALSSINFSEYDFIALSAFIWNEFLINPLLQFIRFTGFKGKIILGGSQITYGKLELLKLEYPEADIFISGYGEQAFLNALKDHRPNNYYNQQPDFSQLPSPYLSNQIKLIKGQKMIRWETKRGCPYRCSFCSHRNLENGRVNYLEVEKSFMELSHFKELGVKKVNVLDPIFNIGSSYLPILKEINRLDFKNTVFTFQSKIELLEKTNGKEFLDLIKKSNSHLEFGLQTINPLEYNLVERKNDIEVIKKQIQILREREISFEVSLIYGLPGQTVGSFSASIEYLWNNGVTNITAWPLMLLKGTKLYDQKSMFEMKEETLGEYQIPVVTSSYSFSKENWLEMQEISKNLIKQERII